MNWKGLEVSGRDLFEVISQHLPVGTEEAAKNLIQDVNPAPSELSVTWRPICSALPELHGVTFQKILLLLLFYGLGRALSNKT
jgi:hypothetical protein